MIDTKGLVSTGGVGNLTTAGTALAIDTTNVTENIFGGFDTVSVITTHDTINDYSANDTINVAGGAAQTTYVDFGAGETLNLATPTFVTTAAASNSSTSSQSLGGLLGTILSGLNWGCPWGGHGGGHGGGGGGGGGGSTAAQGTTIGLTNTGSVDVFGYASTVDAIDLSRLLAGTTYKAGGSNYGNFVQFDHVASTSTPGGIDTLVVFNQSGNSAGGSITVADFHNETLYLTQSMVSGAKA